MSLEAGWKFFFQLIRFRPPISGALLFFAHSALIKRLLQQPLIALIGAIGAAVTTELTSGAVAPLQCLSRMDALAGALRLQVARFVSLRNSVGQLRPPFGNFPGNAWHFETCFMIFLESRFH